VNNEIGLCSACKNQSDCNMHSKNPEVKVIDCQRFSMVDALRKAWEMLRSKDGEQE